MCFFDKVPHFRVVQRNLVLVHGLPIRLTDIECLKRNEYFGQFGKIYKIVIGTANNVITSNASGSTPAQVTYTLFNVLPILLCISRHCNVLLI